MGFSEKSHFEFWLVGFSEKSQIEFQIENLKWKSHFEISIGNLKSNFQLEISIRIFDSKTHFHVRHDGSYENLISKIKPEKSAKISFRKSITQSQTDSTNLRDTQSSVLLHHHSFSP